MSIMKNMKNIDWVMVLFICFFLAVGVLYAAQGWTVESISIGTTVSIIGIMFVVFNR